MMRLYTDENVRGSIIDQLRKHGFDILRAQDDIPSGTADEAVLARASELNYVLYSEDNDLLVEAVRCQRAGIAFSGVVYSHQLRVSIGQVVADLKFVLTIGEARDFENKIYYLPLS